MRILATVVILAAVANEGCGDIQGAYFTPTVLQYTDVVAPFEVPGLLQPRAFASAIVVDDEHYLVAGGFVAAHDGDPADDAHSIELCSVSTGCVHYGDTEDTNQADVFVESPRRGVAFLDDGTVVTESLVLGHAPDGG